MILSTTDHLEGYKITEYLGIIGLSAPHGLDIDKFVFTNGEEKPDAIIGIKPVSSECDCELIGTAVKIEKL